MLSWFILVDLYNRKLYVGMKMLMVKTLCLYTYTGIEAIDVGLTILT